MDGLGLWGSEGVQDLNSSEEPLKMVDLPLLPNEILREGMEAPLDNPAMTNGACSPMTDSMAELLRIWGEITSELAWLSVPLPISGSYTPSWDVWEEDGAEVGEGRTWGVEEGNGGK